MYEPGDYVLIRAKVLEVGPEQVLVDMFSKTDQYPSWVSERLLQGKTDPPAPEEPDRTHSVVQDSDGDFWVYKAERGWHCTSESCDDVAWTDLHRTLGPLRIFEEI